MKVKSENWNHHQSYNRAKYRSQSSHNLNAFDKKEFQKRKKSVKSEGKPEELLWQK
jgi:hypothetical protein